MLRCTIKFGLSCVCREVRVELYFSPYGYTIFPALLVEKTIPFQLNSILIFVLSKFNYRHKRGPSVWFYLLEILEQAKPIYGNRNKVVSWDQGWRRLIRKRKEGNFRLWKCSLLWSRLWLLKVTIFDIVKLIKLYA